MRWAHETLCSRQRNTICYSRKLLWWLCSTEENQVLSLIPSVIGRCINNQIAVICQTRLLKFHCTGLFLTANILFSKMQFQTNNWRSCLYGENTDSMIWAIDFRCLAHQHHFHLPTPNRLFDNIRSVVKQGYESSIEMHIRQLEDAKWSGTGAKPKSLTSRPGVNTHTHTRTNLACLQYTDLATFSSFRVVIWY